ncbi:ATP-binding cassette domain-containing protein [Burkholderiaceae bacterium FT117]|uniref:ABC-F family ATP-binding cassette domain-containing protein n=1 Tax=Zeimonas sediminis TaxID=2944268 RepID=UPI0023431296|nr:ATP-binding cassette domain-containing protein [Zeimonas sediminis]MCM5569170.1 ATP-binding cassette domain-containing protein [Zeimonas sediminis]
MIRLRGVSLSRGGRTLIADATLSISPGERVALIGANGSGKTTLLGALAGELSPDRGDIDQPWRKVIRLEQSLPSSPLPAWRFVVDSDPELAAARAELADAERSHDGLALAHAHDRWNELEGHGAEARCRALLAGLGFSDAETDRPVDALSGGWRMRLNLARALFGRSELLLLDEPTNHLDLDAVLWLERWLLRYPGTAIIVSHDRDFLDRVATASLHIDEGRIVRYAGGYSEFERLRALHAQQAERKRAADAARVAHLQNFIERFRAKATKARQAQSRIKALEKIAIAAPVRALRGVEFTLHEVGDCPDPMLVAEDVDAGYGDVAILRDVNLTIRRGARIGVLGRNGAGKSTLIRTLVGELPPLAGSVRPSRAVRIGYFAQQGIDRLRPAESPLWHLQHIDPKAREQALRDRLGSFGFSGDDATRPVGPMSGGEKARLSLALMLHDEPQLLVLDEPTNHLDAQTRDALADALADFDGAVLLVSHDRYLLRATVDTLMLVRDGSLQEFDGDLDDYADWLLKSRPAAEPAARAAPAGATGAAGGGASGPIEPAEARGDRREARRLAAEKRARLSALLGPIERRMQALEKRLGEAEGRLTELDRALADPAVYEDGGRAAELSRERGLLARQRDEIEHEWLEAAAERDRLAEEASAPG